jgi:conjugative transfer signal peptidase TraF
MRIDHASRRALVIVGIAALLTLAASPSRSPLVLFNRTPSLPTGFYLRCGERAQRGDVVAFALPPAAWQYARSRGERTDVLLLKHVLAVRGDFVSTLDGELRVNGVRVGSIASADSAGRPLPHWSAARVLDRDELLVGSSHVRSFDSRYFGPIHTGQVLGVYQRLSFHSPSTAPTQSGSPRDPLPQERPPPIACDASGGPSDGERSKLTGEEHESNRAR